MKEMDFPLPAYAGTSFAGMTQDGVWISACVGMKRRRLDSRLRGNDRIIFLSYRVTE